MEKELKEKLSLIKKDSNYDLGDKKTRFQKGHKSYRMLKKENGNWKHGLAIKDRLNEYRKMYTVKYGKLHNLKNKDNIRNHALTKKFGITIKQYEQILETQGGLCSICKQKSSRNLAVDHDHETGNIRGLLCVMCNAGLGMFKDN